MTLKKTGLTRKKVEEIPVANMRFKDSYKGEKIRPMFERLFKQCKGFVCGPRITCYDYGVYSDGVEVEVCLPVTQPVETGEVETRTLESVEVLSITHEGSPDRMRESISKLYRYLQEHGIVATSLRRDIVLNFNPKKPEENMTEIQAVLHKWEERFSDNLDRVLGQEMQKEITQGRDKLPTLETTVDERARWIKTAIEKLDQFAATEQKYDILSCCAHDFSQKRIAKLRAIYEKTHDIDEVIKAMHKDTAWYEKPRREGNIIHVKKIPFDRESHKKATSQEEKRKHYCHCAMVRNHLTQGISPTFCYCGSGWYRQQWEGIIRKPVKLEITKSLLKGDDTCEFAIHLPI